MQEKCSMELPLLKLTSKNITVAVKFVDKTAGTSQTLKDVYRKPLLLTLLSYQDYCSLEKKICLSVLWKCLSLHRNVVVLSILPCIVDSIMNWRFLASNTCTGCLHGRSSGQSSQQYWVTGPGIWRTSEGLYRPFFEAARYILVFWKHLIFFRGSFWQLTYRPPLCQ